MAELLPGIVVAVSEEQVGTQVAVTAGGGSGSSTIPLTIPAVIEPGSGSTELVVDDVSMFNPTGGRVTIDGVAYDYVKTDDEASTITLAAPLPTTVPEGALVLADPVRVEKTAMVLVDGNSDPIPAVVPLNMHDALAVGIRNEENREEVRLTSAGQWSFSLFDIDGVLVRDGSHIDPETLPDAGPDIPPTVSPEPKVYGAFGALVVAWDEVAANVTVDVFVSTSSPVDTDAPVASVAGGGVGLQWVRTLADGTPLQTNATYYVTLIARNSGGSAAASAEATGSPAVAGTSDVNITADMLIANLALFEALAAQDVHVTGELIAKTLTALGKVALRHPANELGQGSWLYMQGGTTAPVTSATVVQGWDAVTYSSGYSVDRAWRFGGHWHDNRLYFPISVSGSSQIQSVGLTGTRAIWANHSQLGGGSFDARGVTRLGTNWYVLGKDYNAGGQWRVRVYDSAWLKTGEWSAYASTIPHDPAIGNDGTNILLARAWGSGDVHIQTHNPWSGVELSDVKTPINVSAHLSSVMRGNFDYGSTRTVISTRDRSGGDMVFVLNGSNVRVTGDEWTLADRAVGALAWDGTNFRHLSRLSEKMWTYAADMSTTRRWVAAAWAQGSNETTMGPATSYVPVKRKRALFGFPDLPSGATGMSVYVGQGNTEPTRTGFYRQAANHPSADYAMPGAPTLSGANPLATSTYPGGEPSGIKSDNGTYYFDSTGALHVRTLSVASGQPDAGTTSVTTDGNGWATITHGLGAVPSAVVPAQASNTGGTIDVATDSSTWTATTFQVRLRDSTGAQIASTTRTISWVVYP